MVRAMAGFGVPHDDIALVVKCSPPTLRKRFRHELDVATIEANTRVAQTLYQQATTPGNIAATIFWLKARAGWREKQVVEVAGQDGAVVPALNLAIRYVSSEPLSEAEWVAAHGNKSTANETQQIFPPYKKEDR
jgi:hypothetical protein